MSTFPRAAAAFSFLAVSALLSTAAQAGAPARVWVGAAPVPWGAWGVLGGEGAGRGGAQAARANGPHPRRYQQQRDSGAEPEQGVAERRAEQPNRHQPDLADAMHERALPHGALHDDSEEAGIHEDISDLLGSKRRAVPGEAALGEQGKAGREGRECKHEEEEFEQESAQYRPAEVLPVRSPIEQLEALAAGADRSFVGLGFVLGMRRHGRQEEDGAHDA